MTKKVEDDQGPTEESRRRVRSEVEQWCKEQGGVESITYNSETGAPMKTYTIKLKK